MPPSSIPLLVAAAFLTLAPIAVIAVKAKLGGHGLPGAGQVRQPHGVRPREAILLNRDRA
jgi:hypothetical protein